MTTTNAPLTSPAPSAHSLVRGRPRSRVMRRIKDRMFAGICLVAAIVSVASLAALLSQIAIQGLGRMTWAFITGVPSRFAGEAGIWPAMIGTIFTCIVCAVAAIPIGVGTAILLEEFCPKHPLLRRAHGIIQLNITNLAGVPSIVYGILGLTVFVQVFGWFGTQQNPAVEIGITWYDQFITEDKQTVRVVVDGRGAPVTEPAAVTQWLNAEGKPARVQLVDRQALAPQLQALEADLDRYEEALADRLEAVAFPDVAAIEAAVRDAWAQAGFSADVEQVLPIVAPLLTDAQQLTGRDRRRAMRHASRAVESAIAQERFAGILLADTQPSRVSDARPWYLRLPMGRSVLAGGLTLMLVVLPVVIIASQESLRAVPRSQRQASLALGATPWQTVWRSTLPSAIPGIMTGTILAMSRAIGEAAPILVVAGVVFITFTPGNLMDDFTVMPLQIYNWASRPVQEFHNVAAAGMILLLGILLTFNALAVLIRQRAQK